MRLHALTLCLAVTAPATLPAATIGEELSRLVINPLNASDFEVVETQTMGPAEFWCAAASFNELRQGGSERIALYVKTPRGPSLTQPGRKGVVFTTNPAGLPERAAQTSLNVDKPGLSLRSAQARRYCRDAFTRSTK
ncbi:MAG: hypothetical protein AAFY38_12420 [Pseudomonadota bacterium]